MTDAQLQLVILIIALFGIFTANASLILWFRSESREDWRHSDNLIKAIHEEIKDFHTKLLRIDNERIKK